MTGKCKLTYFPVTAYGEPIRWILSYGNIEFEDYRFEREQWPSIKPNMPFGRVPVLEFEGKTLHQTAAICRYLAKRVGLSGKTDEENYEIDMLVDTFSDLRVDIEEYYYNPDEKSKAAKRDPLINDTLPYNLGKYDTIVKNNGGYFVGGKLTWADITFVCYVRYWSAMLKCDLVEKYPALKALSEKVLAVPQIAAFLEKAPKSDL